MYILIYTVINIHIDTSIHVQYINTYIYISCHNTICCLYICFSQEAIGIILIHLSMHIQITTQKYPRHVKVACIDVYHRRLSQGFCFPAATTSMEDVLIANCLQAAGVALYDTRDTLVTFSYFCVLLSYTYTI